MSVKDKGEYRIKLILAIATLVTAITGLISVLKQ